MKKLYLAVGAIFVPVLLYAVIFFCNDPHSYFTGDPHDGTLAGEMLDYRNGAYDALLLGDSRVAGLDTAWLDQRNGLHYKNMAYGGCMSTEMISLFWWCVDNQNMELKDVIIVTGFYNMNVQLQQDRVASTEAMIKNPVNYAFSFDNLRDCIGVIGDKLKNGRRRETAPAAAATTPETTPAAAATTESALAAAEPPAQETAAQEEISAQQKEQNFETVRNAMTYYLENYVLDEELIEGFLEIERYCEDHQITLKFVSPPCWEGFFDELDKYGLLEMIDGYKASLSQRFPVCDMEYEACPLSLNYEDFSDYTHFHGQTEEHFKAALAGDEMTYARLWENGELAD